jgi:dihydrofolate synthase/folylpolyglutamate synthase
MTLSQWLFWQETQRARQIDLGLERTRPILQRMRLHAPPHTVITVAGTNGKGSSVALLEAILHTAGYRVGAYTSPHLLRYNERVRVQGNPASDTTLCEAFQRIEDARRDTTLTYFEYATLAAFDIFQRAELDVAVLEVGLGGRLDTVNLQDADAALVTSIGIDHVEYLGPDREAIGFEKAGIFRAHRPAVCGDPDPPSSLLTHAAALAAPLYCARRDFDYTVQADSWSWWGKYCNKVKHYEALPYPALRGGFQLQNAAGVLMVLMQLTTRLPVTQEHVCSGLRTVNLAGRFQVIPGAVTRIFDVAHNPHGAVALASALREHPCQGRTLAVFAMLADKDVAGVVAVMSEIVDAWYIAGLSMPRGITGEKMRGYLRGLDDQSRTYTHDTVNQAFQHALTDAMPGDRVITFGSFHTVEEALKSG